MKTEKELQRLLEWLRQELECEFARIQKEKEIQSEFLLDLIEVIQQMLDGK